MNEREAELLEQIGQIIERLQDIQQTIAGTRQPPSTFELESLRELGSRYAELYEELQEWYRTRPGSDNDDTPR